MVGHTCGKDAGNPRSPRSTAATYGGDDVCLTGEGGGGDERNIKKCWSDDDRMTKNKKVAN